jgi:hypothetical protein
MLLVAEGAKVALSTLAQSGYSGNVKILVGAATDIPYLLTPHIGVTTGCDVGDTDSSELSCSGFRVAPACGLHNDCPLKGHPQVVGLTMVRSVVPVVWQHEASASATLRPAGPGRCVVRCCWLLRARG